MKNQNRRKAKAKASKKQPIQAQEPGGVLRQEMKQVNRNVATLLGVISSIEIKTGVLDGSGEKTDFKTMSPPKGVMEEVRFTNDRLLEMIKAAQKTDSRLKKVLG